MSNYDLQIACKFNTTRVLCAIGGSHVGGYFILLQLKWLNAQCLNKRLSECLPCQTQWLTKYIF